MTSQTLLMTRARAASERFVTRLSEDALRGVTVIHAPLIEILPVPQQVSVAAEEGVVFTSANGVRFGPDGGGRRAFCVGQRTAEAATARGWNVVLTAPDAQGLINRMSEGYQRTPLTHLAGRHRRGAVAEHLGAQGWKVKVQEVYDQPVQPLTSEARTALTGDGRVILPLFSPRTAMQFASQASTAPNAIVIALSPAVRDALGAGRYAQTLTLAQPTGALMVEAIENALKRDRLA